MKSSDETTPREADMTSTADIPSSRELEAEAISGLSRESMMQYRIRKFDIRVQLGRLAVLFVGWWLWWSETLWNGWEGLSVFGVQPFPNVNQTFRTSPAKTWDYFTEIYHEQLFWQDLWITAKEATIGFLIAAVLGIVFGVLFGQIPRLRKVFGPFTILVNAMPKIAFLPLILVVYGVGEMSKVVLVVLIAFFIVQVPTQAAVSLVNPDLDMVARTMGATQLQIFKKVVIPGIMPAILGALRLAAIVSVQAAVFGEIFAARRGLGQRLMTSANMLEYGDLFAIVAVLALIALLLNGVIGRAEQYLLRWRSDDQSGQVISASL